MSSTLSPNMNLIVPGVGTEAGPTYAEDINVDLGLLDQHSHTSGSGVPITSAAININAALTFNDNFATNLAGLSFQSQSSTPAIKTAYASNNTNSDLYYVDGLGNNVQITSNGGIAGSPGSISNLTSPASAAYVAGTSSFVWQSNTGIAANMDAGSLLLRNISPNSTYALTLSPPDALASNYEIKLPALPASQKFMTLDSTGALAAAWAVDNSTLAISSNQVIVKAGGITTTQIANATILAANIASGTITTTQISNSAGITGTQIATATITDSNIAANTISGSSINSNVQLQGTAVKANSLNLCISFSNEATMYKVARGYFNGVTGAAISGGGGMTCSVNGITNEYTITFAGGYNTIPCVHITPMHASAQYFATLTAQPSPSTAKFKIYDLSGTATQVNFALIAIAP